MVVQREEGGGGDLQGKRGERVSAEGSQASLQ